jgi:multiple sugar transport system substrate-binding protein
MGKGKQDYGWAGLNNYIMMNKNSKHKDAAWKAIKFWGTVGQIYMCKAGKVPSWKKVNQDDALKGMLGKDPEKIFDVESYRRSIFQNKFKRFVNSKTTAYPEIVKIWQEETEKVIGGQ